MVKAVDHFIGAKFKQQNPGVFVVILWLIFCLGLTFLVVFNRNLVIDDAYITFQYAKNFAEYFKPWYNLDPEFQGNGQTSILWMLVWSLFNFFRWPSEQIFYLINLLLGYILIWKMTFRLFSEKGNWAEILLKIAVLAFFTFWLGLNATHGLETVLAAVVLFLVLEKWGAKTNWYVLLLPLVRPEFALVGFCWVLNSLTTSRQDLFYRFLLFSGSILLFAAFYLGFYDYYIPLPLILKSGFYINNLVVYQVFLGRLLVFIPVLFCLFKDKKYVFALPLVFFLFYYSFSVNSYSSGIYIRYFFPLMVYFISVHFSGIKKKSENVIFYVLMVFSVLRMVDLGGNFLEDRKSILIDNLGFKSSYGVLSKKLTSKDRVLVMDAGHVAYFSKATTYDGYGLNDATLLLATKTKDEKRYKAYVERKKINKIALVSKSGNAFDPRPDGEFPYKVLGLKNHKILAVLPMDRGFYLFVFKN